DGDGRLRRRSRADDVLVGRRRDDQLLLGHDSTRSGEATCAVDRLTPQVRVLGTNGKRATHLATLCREVTDVEGTESEVVVFEVVVDVEGKRLCGQADPAIGQLDVSTDDQGRVVPNRSSGRGGTRLLHPSDQANSTRKVTIGISLE